MRFCRFLILLSLALILGTSTTFAQYAPVCDSGGVCATDPSDPAYAGLLASRVQRQNARGSRNPMVAVVSASAPAKTVIGSQSYNRAFPILSLPGRGLDLSLTLYYNSRVWTFDPSSNTMSFNSDRDWPSYGFRLGFGFIEYDSVNSQMIVTESDGSKHALPLSNSAVPTYDSTDGSFLEFNGQNLQLSYRDGRTVLYQLFPSSTTLYRPIQIMDRNRNFISISYVAGLGNEQHIDHITDTLMRVIQFNYLSGRLQTITQAVNGVTRTWASFAWSTSGSVPFTFNFAAGINVTGVIQPSTGFNVITSVTYPNNTGYKFSYGAWGIVNRIDCLSSTGLTREYESFAYPDASQPLSDVPRYSQMSSSPDGTAASAVSWNYSETQSAPGMVTSETISDPLGTTTSIALNSDGTLNSISTTGSNPSHLYSTTQYAWQAAGASTMIASITTTDDANNSKKVSYGYDSNGNITDLQEFDFATSSSAALLRETVTSYKGAPFTSQHILNLPQSIQVKDGNGVVMSRTDFDYDSPTPGLSSISGTLVQNDGNTAAPRGNLTSVTRYPDPVSLANPIIRTFVYDVAGNVTVAQVDCCNQKKFTYDPATNYAYLSSMARGPDTGPFTSTFAFNPDNGLLTQSTDENGQLTRYGYDVMFRLNNVTPPAGGATRLTTYVDDAAAPQVYTTTSANSLKILQTFDGLGRLTRQDTIDTSTGNIVSTSKFVNDEIGRRIKVSNPYSGSEPVLWNITGLDPLGRTTSITPPSGGGISFTYGGNTVLITDPANKQRKNFFDALGRLVRVDEPGWGDALDAIDSVSISGTERSTLVSTRYCAQYTFGNPPRCVDWEFDTSTDYDTGNVTTTINGVQYSQSYGQSDNPSTIASNLAGKINSDPNRVVNASPSGSTINFFAVNPGASGNNITVSSSSATSDTAEFSAGSTSFPATTYTPTLSGGENAVSQANAVLTATRHLTTTYGYDALGHLTSVSQGAIGPINGQNLAGQVRTYGYDPLGRLTSSATPEVGTVTNYYTDQNGLSCSGDPSLACRIIDARGVVRNLTYDGFNRPKGMSYSNDPAGTPSVSYQYDFGGSAAFALDRLTKITDGAESQTFAYDNLGRVSTLTTVVDSNPAYPVTYTYNSANQVTKITYPSGRQVKPAYDSVGRLSQISDPAFSNPYININSADYSSAGQVTLLTLGNGVIGKFGFNDHLQLSSLRYYNPAAPAGTADVLNLGYDYTGAAQQFNNGQIQAIHYYSTPGVEDQTHSESFSYDPWGRLAQAQTLTQGPTGTWNLQWGYDRLGNRLNQGGSGNGVFINAPNFIVDPGSNHIIGYCYDSAGNLTDESGCPAAGSPHRYSYDGMNRLIAVNTGAATAAYSYIGPIRVKKVAGTTTTIYVYSGNTPIAEYAPGAAITNPTREYVYTGSRMLASVAGSILTYYHPDHLSNRAETDSTGTAIRRMGHFPYGDNWYDSNPAEKWKFTSYERDSGAGETGLDYAMFRYYASSQGRFVSPDLLSGKIGTPESLNRYAYTMNDPINRIDPSGLVSLVGGCSGDDWCSGPIDLAGGFGDDPGRDTCPKDAPGCFNNGPEGGGGGDDGQRDPKNRNQALYCNYLFQLTLIGAFAKTNYGQNAGGRAEAGFAVNVNGIFGPYAVGVFEHLAISAFGPDTLAVVHTHGNSMAATPSNSPPGPGNPFGGDVYTKVPNYVYSVHNGVPTLYVTDPSTNDYSGPLDMGQTGCPAAVPGFSQTPTESYT
jgi:RHS repeat-associated protein